LLLKTIFLLALSGCKGKEVVEVHTLNMRENKVNTRLVTFDNKDCSITTQFVETNPLDLRQNGYICITPEQFNKGYLKYQDKQCK
jgi:hypothetical protein